jgi:CRP/FNR family transcriptional regulator, cyclic AMP receptor protein
MRPFKATRGAYTSDTFRLQSRITLELELTGFGGFEGVELLQKLHLFKLLTFDETTRLGGIIQYLDVPEGAVVIDQNALGDALYVIARGEVRVSRDLEADGRHDSSEEIGRLSEGEVFGEMSLIDDVLTSARVTTVTPCRLLKLPRGAFEQLLQADERLAVKVYRSFCRTLSDRLRRTTAMLARSQAMQVSLR